MLLIRRNRDYRLIVGGHSLDVFLALKPTLFLFPLGVGGRIQQKYSRELSTCNLLLDHIAPHVATGKWPQDLKLRIWTVFSQEGTAVWMWSRNKAIALTPVC